LVNLLGTNIPVVQAQPAPPPLILPLQFAVGPNATALEPVNVRSGPGEQYPSYGDIPNGTVVNVMGVSSNYSWLVIRIPKSYAESGIGWVNAAFLALSNAAPTDLQLVLNPQLTYAISQTATNTGATALQTIEPTFIYAAADNQSQSLGSVPAGTPLDAQGVSSDHRWVKVNLASTGVSGWVSAAYLQVFDPSKLQMISTP